MIKIQNINRRYHDVVIVSSASDLDNLQTELLIIIINSRSFICQYHVYLEKQMEEDTFLPDGTNRIRTCTYLIS